MKDTFMTFDPMQLLNDQSVGPKFSGGKEHVDSPRAIHGPAELTPNTHPHISRQNDGY